MTLRLSPSRLLASTPPLAALGLVLAVAACDDPAEDPRVQRLQNDLAMAQQSIASLERRLAETTSARAEREALRNSLAQAEARIAELETPAGIADAAAAKRRGEGEIRERLVAATAALRAADTRLARLEGEGNAVDDALPEDAARAARADVATAAENIVEAASTLGIAILGMAR